MRNLILAATALVAFTSFAEARDRYHHRYYHQPQYQRHHYRPPPVYRNYNPYIYGGIGLGLLGAGIYYHHRPSRCWYELVEYDYAGNPLYVRQCE